MANPASSFGQGDVLALGNFDGVHIGHVAVLRAAAARAQKDGARVRVLTFDPHPQMFFGKNLTPFLLTPEPLKQRFLLAAGAQDVVTVPFTAALAAMNPETFVAEILLAREDLRHVVVGHDFAFGAGREGDGKRLRDILAGSGVGFSEVPSWRDAGGEIVSSTRVREALKRGDPLLARQLMGRPFMIEGEVLHGDKRGRTMGFPTANIGIGDFIRPMRGVYAGKARRAGEDKAWPAVINIGVRPTVDGEAELVEAHLLGFDRDMYGQNWTIELWAFLREEKKFPDLEALKNQIALDAAEARRFSGL